ncbi:MAG: hypothetical protein Q9168_002704 [Polycauliona sp. 1 TL-2023]
MSVEANHLRSAVQPAQPIKSSSSVNPRNRPEDDASSKTDKAVRRYAAGIDRALSLFDTALQEWADYLPFLARLLKVPYINGPSESHRWSNPFICKALQLHPPGISDIPHKSLVAQRLSQCLNPALPAGVHQEALKVYTYIFSLIGVRHVNFSCTQKDGLGRDLPYYLPGLSPVLAFASLLVKPPLLALFDAFIVALDPVDLRPALKAILMSLLPGLEEESSEEFERTHAILQRLRSAMSFQVDQEQNRHSTSGDQYFWQCLFLVTITSKSRRPGVLSYLQRHLPRLGRAANSSGSVDKVTEGHRLQLSDDVEAVTSPEPGLLIRCFAAGLSDDQLLVQRGFLDLLVTHLPLNSGVLHSKVSPADHVKLVTAAVSVVARREMSLNRRLWTWFLGPEEPPAEKNGSSTSPNMVDGQDRFQGRRVKYFHQHGLDVLVQSILSMFDNDATSSEKARPFRISLALMDQWEIGGYVVPKIFLPALRSVFRYQKAAPTSEAFEEVLRSANVFFDGVESGLIWDEISNKLLRSTETQVTDPRAFQDSLKLAAFIMKNFNLQDEEMLTRHMPLLVLSLVLKSKGTLNGTVSQEGLDHVNPTLDLAGKLLDMVPGRAFATQILGGPASVEDRRLNLEHENDKFLTNMKKYYVDAQEGTKSDAPVIDNASIARLILQNIIQLIIDDLGSGSAARLFLDAEISILEKLYRRTSVAHLVDVTDILSILEHSSQAFATKSTVPILFKHIASTLFLLETLHVALASTSWLGDHRLRPILSNLLSGIWPHLSPTSPKSNVEAVRCVWKIQSLSTDTKLVESCIAALMVESGEGQHQSIENGRRFATLWSHSNSSYGTHSRRPSMVPATPKPGSAVIRTDKEHILARPLLLLLDSLEDPRGPIFTFTCGWLQSSANIEVILEFLQQMLQADWLSPGEETGVSMQAADAEEGPADLDEYMYYLQTLSSVVEYTPREIWSSLLSHVNAFNVHSNVNIEQGHASLPRTEQRPPTGFVTNQVRLTDVGLKLFVKRSGTRANDIAKLSRLKQAAASLLQKFILRSSSLEDIAEGFESPVIATLVSSVRDADHPLQVSLMSLLSVWLRRRGSGLTHNPVTGHRRLTSDDHSSERTSSLERPIKEGSRVLPASPAPSLLDCIMEGLGASGSQPVIHHWIQFLDFCLPYYTSIIFQILMPLVERFAKTVSMVFEDLRTNFRQDSAQPTAAVVPVNTMLELLNGLEQILARAHERLIEDESSQHSAKSPEQVQGFFGNMVSGVFASDGPRTRSTTANNRLTVVLCFKDVVKLCLKIWSWGGDTTESSLHGSALSGSFNHTSLRLRNRARRVLEHIFAAESLECLETLIEAWYGTKKANKSGLGSSVVLNLLHVLDGSRPRNTIPAIFNALYSRTNPDALDPERKSTLTSELLDTDLARFLVEYTRSLEDDAMDEIWSDCIAFLKDILTNPLPHRQSLPQLLEFTALLGAKVDNTNFGENRKRRKELSDLFLRQLAATFTIKPLNVNIEYPSPQRQRPLDDSLQAHRSTTALPDDDIVVMLATIFPGISKVLVDSDRMVAAANTVSAQVIVPTVRSKSFPHNVTASFLELFGSLTRITEASKGWKKDIADAFNDPRLFCRHTHGLASSHWLPLIRQWIILDKERMADFVSRSPSPTSAGIMFGVGASSARLEADRKTQLNLRRVATLLLAATGDSFVENIGPIQDKMADLLTATAASSPSSAIRAEIYMVFRAMVLKIAPVHLALLWPLITKELHEALSSLYPGRNRDRYNMHCIVHVCKLLDNLVLIAPEDFQMRQWLFITDTIDAVYRPPNLEPRALVDELAEDLDANAGTSHIASTSTHGPSQVGGRKPLLTAETLESIRNEDLLDRAIRPFLRQLSINTFEGTYSMTASDWQASYDDLLLDIFDEKTLV